MHRTEASTSSTPAKLLPVSISEGETSTRGGSVVAAPPKEAAARLAIEIGGARVLVEGNAIDRAALRAVIDCLRESGSQ